MCRVLERAAAIVAGHLLQEPALRCQATMEFLHRVDRIAEMFEGLMHPEDAHFATFIWSALVEIDGNPPAMHTRRPRFGVVHQI